MYRYRNAVRRDQPDRKQATSNGRIDQRTIANIIKEHTGHICLVGKTGTGKSNMLKILLREIMDADNNVLLLDPHGTLSDWGIQHNAKKDLVFLSGHDYSGEEIFSGTNMIACDERAQDPPLVSAWLKEILSSEDSLSHGTWGPRLEVIFGPLLIECMRNSVDLTLKDFQSLLMERNVLLEMLEKSKNLDLANYIRMQSKDAKQWIDLVSSAMNKLLPILENEEAMRISSLKGNNSIILRNMLESGNKQICLDSNESSMGGSAYRIVSALLLARIWNTLRRIGPASRKIYIVLDEAHSLPQKIVSTLLTEGRKYGVIAILSYQYLAQQTREGLASIFGNIGNFIIFPSSYEDADILSRNMLPIEHRKDLLEAIMKQGRHSATFYFSVSENRYGPVSLTPEKIDDNVDLNTVERLKIESIRRYGSEERAGSLKENPEISLHETVIRRLSLFLRGKGYNCERGNAFGAVIPDLVATSGLNRYYFEVEISDVASVFRVAKKLKDYNGQRMVLVFSINDAARMLDILGKILGSGKSIEAYHRGGMSIMGQEIHSSILNLYLMAFDNSDFLIYNGSDYVKFMQSQLLREPSLIRRAKKLRFPQVRTTLLKDLASSDRYKSRDLQKIMSKYDTIEISRLTEHLKKLGYQDLSISALLEL